MWKIGLIAVFAVVLAGCGDIDTMGDRRAYERLKVDGTSQQRCDLATKIKDTYARTPNESAYREWKGNADLDCISARIQATREQQERDRLARTYSDY